MEPAGITAMNFQGTWAVIASPMVIAAASSNTLHPKGTSVKTGVPLSRVHFRPDSRHPPRRSRHPTEREVVSGCVRVHEDFATVRSDAKHFALQ